MLAYPVYKIGDEKPPYQCTYDDGDVARYGFKKNNAMLYEGKSGKQTNENKDDERITETNNKGRNEIVKIRPFLVALFLRADGCNRIASECIIAKGKQHDRTQQLEDENILVDII